MTPVAWPVAVACRLRLCRLLGPSLMMMWSLMSKDVGLLGPYIANDASFFKQHVSGDWLVSFGLTNLAHLMTNLAHLMTNLAYQTRCLLYPTAKQCFVVWL